MFMIRNRFLFHRCRQRHERCKKYVPYSVAIAFATITATALQPVMYPSHRYQSQYLFGSDQCLRQRLFLYGIRSICTPTITTTCLAVHEPLNDTRQVHTTATTTIQIPEPKHRHIILPPPPMAQQIRPSQSNVYTDLPNQQQERRSGILVIGDVHGCYDEMMLLYNKAIVENNNQLFYYVILVGDICNKGPQSMQVIRHVQHQQQLQLNDWVCIRGNHENSVLRAYVELKTSTSSLSSNEEKKNSRYRWLLGESIDNDRRDKDKNTDNMKTANMHTQLLQFTNEDYEWMSNLPYTIRIPANHIGLSSTRSINNENKIDETSTPNSDHDTIIVHAGLIPGIPIEENDISTMVTVREISVPDSHDNNSNDIDDNRTKSSSSTVPWATVWDGPELVIFGHDAKRGLQIYNNNNNNDNNDKNKATVIGIDTGCVYGNHLTGIILPSRTIVQVNALKQHVPIHSKE